MTRPRIALALVLLASRAMADAEPAAVAPVAASATVPADTFVLSLSGNALTATPFESERVGVIPFGRWANAIPTTPVQHGVQFSAELQSCSSMGCIVTTEDANRIVLAQKDMADAIRLPLYDDGWQRNGEAAISESGMTAVPVASRKGEREIWVIRHNGHIHKRIPHTIDTPVILKWRDDDLYLIAKTNEGFTAQQVLLERETLVSATLIEPWWFRGNDRSTKIWAVGMAGENSDALRGDQTVPIWRQGSAEPGVLELSAAARPMTAGGFSSPVKVMVDEHGRVNMVCAMGDDIWCLRFGSDGRMQRTQKLALNLAGNYKSIQIDAGGRFYFLEVEMEDDQMTPKLMYLVRLK